MVLSLILIFYLACAGANERWAVDAISDINNHSFKLSPQQASCDTCANEEEIFQQCARDLCGPPSKLRSITLSDENIDQYVDAQRLSQYSGVEEDINKILDLTVKKNNSFVDAFNKKNEGKEFDPEFEKWSYLEYGVVEIRSLYPHVKMLVDTSKPLTERVSVIATYPENAKEEEKKAIDDFAHAKKEAVLNKLTSSISENILTLPEARQKVTDVFNQLKNKLKQEQTTNPEFFNQYKEELEQFEKSLVELEKLSRDELFDLANTFSSLSGYYELEKTGNWPADPYFPICESESCKKHTQEYIKKFDFRKMAKELQETTQNNQQRVNFMNNCHSDLISGALTAYDREQMKKTLPQVISAIKQNVLTKFSASSSEHLATYLANQLNFSFDAPGSREDSLQKFAQKIKNKRQELENLPTNESDLNGGQFVLGFFNFLEYGDNKQIKPFNDVSYLCPNGGFSLLWDAFINKEEAGSVRDQVGTDFDEGKDNIQVSAYSCSHVETGRAIIAHEVGHALSAEFFRKHCSQQSSEYYKNLRLCSGRLYKDGAPAASGEFMSHEGDHLRTEEDTADVIEYMAFPKDEGLMNCSLLEMDEKHENYLNLHFKNSIEFDSHSSSFLRIIREVLHKKKTLPKSCQDLVDKYKDEYRFELCF